MTNFVTKNLTLNIFSHSQSNDYIYINHPHKNQIGCIKNKLFSVVVQISECQN